MNLQHERLSQLCLELRLSGIAVSYAAAAQTAAATEASFIDFLETVLRGELETRRARARTMLSRVAGFPAIKDPGSGRLCLCGRRADANPEVDRLAMQVNLHINGQPEHRSAPE